MRTDVGRRPESFTQGVRPHARGEAYQERELVRDGLPDFTLVG